MKTLQQLQKEAHATAVSKGWHEKPLCSCKAWQDSGDSGESTPPEVPDHDRILAKHALIHSELTEAVECYACDALTLSYIEGKPEGFSVEIADTIIRILDTVGALGLYLGVAENWLETSTDERPAVEIRIAAQRDQVVALWLANVRIFVDAATEAVRVNDWERYCNRLGLVVEFLASICAGLGLDLGEAIDAKMAYNKTRPRRHGGKSA